MWVVVWHGRRQVVNAPLALRQCYMSIRKSTGRHTRCHYRRHLVIRRNMDNRLHRYTAGHVNVTSTFNFRATSARRVTTFYFRASSARVSTDYFRTRYSSGNYSLLPGIVCSGIYTLLPGSIQLG
ncbi:hypothetical protein DPMN_004984 [Dreissena polymorpha]|uniref:Uncharacterized protein n=1 Tax=Dreissena polymorpha TaxID=45954 RepID=A0A9D4MPH6_DREPO|nr:hypothetical protein DPMN_004984 [Dreissena polymorpha]